MIATFECASNRNADWPGDHNTQLVSDGWDYVFDMFEQRGLARGCDTLLLHQPFGEAGTPELMAFDGYVQLADLALNESFTREVRKFLRKNPGVRVVCYLGAIRGQKAHETALETLNYLTKCIQPILKIQGLGIAWDYAVKLERSQWQTDYVRLISRFLMERGDLAMVEAVPKKGTVLDDLPAICAEGVWQKTIQPSRDQYADDITRWLRRADWFNGRLWYGDIDGFIADCQATGTKPAIDLTLMEVAG